MRIKATTRTALSIILRVGVIITTLSMIAGCTLPHTSSVSTGPSQSQSQNRWLELLKVLPTNNVTETAAFAQDGTYLASKWNEFPETAASYAVGYRPPMFRRWDAVKGDDEFKMTLGFTLREVNQVVSAGAGPDYYQALQGEFSAAAIDNAVKTGPLNEILEVLSYNGHQFYIWGADREFDLARRSGVRPLGEGSRLALIDDFVFWIPWTAGLEEMINSYDGTVISLADEEEYQLLANGLLSLETVNGFFSMESQSVADIAHRFDRDFEMAGDTARQALYQQEMERAVRLKPYQALATGAGLDSKGYYLAIVLLNPDEDTAQLNATILKERIAEASMVWRGVPWSSFVESSDIGSDGRLTLAKLYGPACEWWPNLGPSGEAPYEPLLLHD